MGDNWYKEIHKAVQLARPMNFNNQEKLINALDEVHQVMQSIADRHQNLDSIEFGRLQNRARNWIEKLFKGDF